jgi:hypothetical protein
MNYPTHQSFEFLQGGDGWIIAHAMDGDGLVVTQESGKTKKSKVKIPTICSDFGITCFNTYAMLDRLGAKF